MNQDLPTIITGTPGDDTLVGTPGIDLLMGLEGDDVLRGGEGHDFLIGGDGDDRLYGEEGHDFLIGGDGDDRLYGEEGHDLLIGGDGDDALYGGAGVDFFDGGAGRDGVSFAGNLFAVRADLTQERATYINEAGVEVVETLLNIETLVGTDFDDQLIGDAAQNNLNGGKGNDTLIGGAGNDGLNGRTGVDFLDGGEGVDTANFGSEGFGITADLSAETTTYTDDQGNTFVEVLRNIERIRATDFDDQLIGNEEDNILWGYDGNDTLIGGEGNDALRGGAGVDFFDGGEGRDGVGFLGNLFAVRADLSQERATFVNEAGVEVVETLLNIESLGGTEFDDELIGDAGNNILDGNAGNDTLIGGAGNDGIFGGAGVDFLDGGEGIDTANFRDEGFGITADLSAETTTYTDDQGNTFVEVLRNIERIRATDFDDQLIGNEEDNILWGNGGNDTLIGGAGNDSLRGSAGMDFFIGGEGNDGFHGQAGADTFAFLSPNQGLDIIVDFNSTEGDIIQISATGFSAGLTPGVLDFDQFIIGSAAADGGDRIIYNDVTGALFFDPDGTDTLGQVQFAQLSANPVLTSSDIVVV